MKPLNFAAGCLVFALVAFGSAIAAFAAEDGRAGAAGLNGDQPFYLAVGVSILFFLGIVVPFCALVWAKRALIREKKWELLECSLITLPGLQLLTIGLIVGAVELLAIVNILNSQATASLLAGIAGYVLGSMQTSRTENGTDRATPREGPSD